MGKFQTIEEFCSAFDKLSSNARSVAIMSHMNPDDDSISSVLTLYSHLTHSYPNKTIDIVYSGDREGRWSYFENFDKIQFVPDESINLDSYDLFIGVDACQYGRFIRNVSALQKYTGKIVFIDHHVATPDACELALVKPEYPACAHLLYDIFYAKNSFDSARLPETIILGILGDTGSFRFIKPQQSAVFSVAERLVREGNFDIQDLLSKYSGYSENILFVIQELVCNISYKEIAGWPRFMYSYLSREFIAEHHVTDNTISSAAGIFVGQYGTAITECSWTMTFTARQTGDVSVSMRSRPGSVNVRLIGQQMGKGGGHDRAGGAKFVSNDNVPFLPELAMQEMFEWLSKNEPTYS